MKSYYDDPEGCLAKMVQNMPEIAILLLDKCITRRDETDDIQYDFFCLESQGNSVKSLKLNAQSSVNAGTYSVVISRVDITVYQLARKNVLYSRANGAKRGY